MGTIKKIAKEEILKYFRKKRVVNLQDLMTYSNYSSKSLQRYLKLWKVYGSYNHNRRHYVLSEFVEFNSDGIGSFKGCYFSKYGNLKQTIIHLVNQSDVGLDSGELEILLKIPLKAVLSIYFKNSSRLNRILENGRYIYFSQDRLIYEKQIQKRKEHEKDRFKKDLPSDANAVAVLVELIKHPSESLDQLTRRVRRGGIIISIDEVRNLLSYHGLLKNLGQSCSSSDKTAHRAAQYSNVVWKSI